MEETILLRNEDVERVLIGVPTGHEHLRIVIEAKGKRIVLQEATVANIVRGFIAVKTHPKVGAVELRKVKVERGKKGFAALQLLETGREEKEVVKNIDSILQA
ncbi:TPA: hypothetical protein EYP26_00165 [Candidatus Bathyarchaeota archaeon]|nr:hypothetical protein [Candidatus Bathyarchaeota archaeon]